LMSPVRCEGVLPIPDCPDRAAPLNGACGVTA